MFKFQLLVFLLIISQLAISYPGGSASLFEKLTFLTDGGTLHLNVDKSARYPSSTTTVAFIGELL